MWSTYELLTSDFVEIEMTLYRGSTDYLRFKTARDGEKWKSMKMKKYHFQLLIANNFSIMNFWSTFEAIRGISGEAQALSPVPLSIIYTCL